MSRITSYTALTSTAVDDVLPIVDVHDTSMAATGTTKQITVANLLATAGGGLSNPMTTLGDELYGGAAGAPTRIAGPTSSVKQFMTSTGTGSAAQAPAWATIAAGDLPTGTTGAQGALQLDGTAGDIKPVGTAAAVGASGKAPDASHVHLGFFGGIFGNASDGALTFDGSTTILGMVPSTSIYTMTRDIQASSITVNNGVTIKTASFRIFCQGTVTINSTGIISNAGNAAAGSTAGAGLPNAVFVGGRAGGGGGSGVSGPGGNGNGSNWGIAGGAGGAGTSGTAGTGGAAANSSTTATSNVLVTPFPVTAGEAAFGGSNQPLGWGAGGGGGGSDASSNAGGGGGGGGGIVAILAWAVANNGTITVGGGAGALAAAGNAGGGGGGAGGLIVAYTLMAWTAGTLTVAGGALGAGHGTGANGVAGGTGMSLNVVLA